MSSASEVDNAAVTAVDKALILLRAFESVEILGVSELARRARLSKSTAFRMLGILQRNGFVERSGSGYRLGRSLYELGSRVYEREPGRMREIALPYLVDLYERTHETVHLAVLHGSHVVYLEKLHGHRSVYSPSRVGARVPAYCTAVGKMLLSYESDSIERVLVDGLSPLTPTTITDPHTFQAILEEIRATGIAFDDEETVRTLTCVAVPILNQLGRPVAAVSISGTRGRFDPKAHAHVLRAVAAEASNAVRRAAGTE